MNGSEGFNLRHVRLRHFIDNPKDSTLFRNCEALNIEFPIVFDPKKFSTSTSIIKTPTPSSFSEKEEEQEEEEEKEGGEISKLISTPTPTQELTNGLTPNISFQIPQLISSLKKSSRNDSSSESLDLIITETEQKFGSKLKRKLTRDQPDDVSIEANPFQLSAKIQFNSHQAEPLKKKNKLEISHQDIIFSTNQSSEQFSGSIVFDNDLELDPNGDFTSFVNSSNLEETEFQRRYFEVSSPDPPIQTNSQENSRNGSQQVFLFNLVHENETRDKRFDIFPSPMSKSILTPTPTPTPIFDNFFSNILSTPGIFSSINSGSFSLSSLLSPTPQFNSTSNLKQYNSNPNLNSNLQITNSITTPNFSNFLSFGFTPSPMFQNFTSSSSSDFSFTLNENDQKIETPKTSIHQIIKSPILTQNQAAKTLTQIAKTPSPIFESIQDSTFMHNLNALSVQVEGIPEQYIDNSLKSYSITNGIHIPSTPLADISVPRKKKGINEDPDIAYQKRLRRKERCRLAATKFRMKKRKEIERLEKETKGIENERDKLAKEVRSLRKKLFDLKSFLLVHKNCYTN